MSKDIRSYFSVSPKVSKQADADKKKKTKNIIISDSESDDEDIKQKTSSAGKSPEFTKKGIKTNKTNDTKSHYFDNLKPAKPADVFGSGSIKRSGVPVKQKKATKAPVENTFGDDDFDKTLMQIDDKSVELLLGESSSKTVSEKDSSIDKNVVCKENGKLKKDCVTTLNGISKSKTLRKETSKKEEKSVKVKSDDKFVCLDLSESSDSEVDVSPKKKSKLDINESVSFGKSPGKSKKINKSDSRKSNIKPVNNIKVDRPELLSSDKSPTKKITEKKKNECMDLSESDSDQESVLSNKLNTQKEKSYVTPSPQKFSKKENEQKTGQKRQLDHKKFDDDSVHYKRQKKSFSSIERDPLRTPVPKLPIVSNLWVDKYKPTNLKQLIGQQGDKSNVKKLINWLQKWKNNHNGKTKLYRPSPWAKDDDGSFFKAALLSGPPGIGKTTTSHLVCQELGYDVVEFNASDTRSKKSLQQEVSELLSTKSLAPYFCGGRDQEVTSNHVLLMDEVDGMAGNEDRGGIQELILLIKSSRVPIICMCNDRNHPKMRSLVNYCYDLRFSRPRVEQIKGAMMSVCFKEGLKISSDQLTDIIKSTNQDIRLILNHLSVLAAQKDSNLPNSEKFVKLGPWDVLRKVFSEEDLKKMSFYDKSDLFFHDYSIAPLFVQENYLSVVPHAKLNKIDKMKVFAKASESIATGDIVEKVIRTSNAWSLLPVEAIFASVVPGEILKGHMGGQINFPSWLGKNSTKNKMDRLQQELLVHTRLKISGSKEAINLDYCNHIRDIIVRPLLQNGSEGVQDALNGLQSYDLLKEDLESLSELCKWPNKKDPMEKVESKVKAAFTRAYNKSSGLSPYAVTATIKKGRSGAGVETGDLLGEDNDEDALLEDVEEDLDNIEVDAMIKAKKKNSKNQQETPSTSKQRGTGKRSGRGSKK